MFIFYDVASSTATSFCCVALLYSGTKPARLKVNTFAAGRNSCSALFSLNVKTTTIQLHLEPLVRIELTTSSLPRKCSTTELQRLDKFEVSG